eukprot:12096281-Karenia_brevis.AAC.1
MFHVGAKLEAKWRQDTARMTPRRITWSQDGLKTPTWSQNNMQDIQLGAKVASQTIQPGSNVEPVAK